MVADDFSEDDDKGTKLKGECEGYKVEDIVTVKEQFGHVFSDSPGKTDVCKLSINTGESRPMAQPPYRIPDKMKEGVWHEIQKL